MTLDLARRALSTIGVPGDEMVLLATGMSSTAWVGIVDNTEFVVRTARDNGRHQPPRYDIEAAVNRALRADGVPAADCRLVVVDGVTCTVAPRLPGRPARPDEWTDGFVADVARALHTTHSLPTRGWGRPVDATTPLRGSSPDGAAAVGDRFWLAPVWPFDGSRIEDHPAARIFPERLDEVAATAAAIRAEAERDPCLVHTDLHWDHLLRDADGRLGGLLDYGDAFIGAVAWDFACLRYYHGDEVTRHVAASYPGGAALEERGRILGTAFMLYKLAKTPTRSDVVDRVGALL